MPYLSQLSGGNDSFAKSDIDTLRRLAALIVIPCFVPLYQMLTFGFIQNAVDVSQRHNLPAQLNFQFFCSG